MTVIKRNSRRHVGVSTVRSVWAELMGRGQRQRRQRDKKKNVVLVKSGEDLEGGLESNYRVVAISVQETDENSWPARGTLGWQGLIRPVAVDGMEEEQSSSSSSSSRALSPLERPVECGPVADDQEARVGQCRPQLQNIQRRDLSGGCQMTMFFVHDERRGRFGSSAEGRFRGQQDL